MSIPAYYSDMYAPAEEPLLARLAATRDVLVRTGMVDLYCARPIGPEKLEGLHDSAYIHAFLTGEEPGASRQGIRWSESVRDAALAMLGGQLQAARHALKSAGFVMNIARGFHHAHPAAGSAFCPMNGLALVAQTLPDQRVLVIDCDEHGGNGTEEFAALTDNLYAVSVFGTRMGCRGGVRSWAYEVKAEEGFSRYRAVLQEVAGIVDEVKPDLVIYQAGADCHENDPKSRLRLTTREMFRRDLMVFNLARQRARPVLFVVAGGYQKAETVARLNRNTVRAARLVQAASGSV